MKRSLLVAVILIAAMSFAIWDSARPEKAPHIVAFGDSLTYGTGSVRGGGYVTFLSEDLDIPIDNLGIPGNTTADALARIDSVIDTKPSVAIVLLGGNDLLQGIPASETAKNLALISARLKNAGIRVLLLKLDILKDVWGHPDLMSDNLHPNDKGYALIAELIRPKLEKFLH